MTNIVTYPTNPNQGQEFTVGETIKMWDGEKWVNKTPTNNPHNVTKSQVGLGDVDNVSAANLRDRGTHTGTHPLSTISDAGTAASKDVGVIDGVASLDGLGKVPDSESQVSSVNGKKGDVVLTANQITYDSSETVKEAIDSKLDADYMALKIFQSLTDGELTEIQTRTVDAGEVYEVRKASDDSLATIYSDADGTAEIVQNGTSNVSGSDGAVTFYIVDGAYYVEVDTIKSNFLTLYNTGFVTPPMYGLVEGFDAGNAEKIELMIASDKPINWGDKSYGVERCIGGGTKISSNIKWISSGCEIFIDLGATHQQAVLWYEVDPINIDIEGKLVFNANFKANTGFYLVNNSSLGYPNGYGTMKTKGLTARNILRTTDYPRGTGILVVGSFKSVTHENPEVTDILMAVGEGNAGIQGISGIETVGGSSGGGYSLSTLIINPTVTRVKSLDPTYNMDQDGCKFFGGRNEEDLLSSFQVVGGRFSNCYGRSIKSQMTSGTVSGTAFHRDEGWTNAKGITEVAGQYGKVTVKNITCDYAEGFAPDTITGQSSTSYGLSTSGVIDGITIKMKGSDYIDSIVSTYSFLNLGLVNVKNISVSGGSINRYVTFHCPDNESKLIMSNCVADAVNDEAVKCLKSSRGTATATLVEVFLSKIVNRSTPVPLVVSRIVGFALNSKISVGDGVIGFTSEQRMSSTNPNQPAVYRVEGLAGNYVEGSYFKPMSGSIPAGGEVEFETHGYSVGTRIAIINGGVNRDSNGVISCSANGAIALAVGSDLSVGETSEPVGGFIKCWINTETRGLVVKNNTGSSKIVTVYYM